jgi:hypothetical protein
MIIDMVTFASVKLYFCLEAHCVLGCDTMRSRRSLLMFWRLCLLFDGSCLAYSSTLKMKAVCSSETSVNKCQTTRRHVQRKKKWYYSLSLLWDPEIKYILSLFGISGLHKYLFTVLRISFKVITVVIIKIAVFPLAWTSFLSLPPFLGLMTTL